MQIPGAGTLSHRVVDSAVWRFGRGNDGTHNGVTKISHPERRNTVSRMVLHWCCARKKRVAPLWRQIRPKRERGRSQRLGTSLCLFSVPNTCCSTSPKSSHRPHDSSRIWVKVHAGTSSCLSTWNAPHYRVRISVLRSAEPFSFGSGGQRNFRAGSTPSALARNSRGLMVHAGASL